MSTSPPYVYGTSTIHSRYVKVPRDQQELLDRPDAWDTAGIVNVPARLLEDLRRFHAPTSPTVSQRAASTPVSKPSAPAPASSSKPRAAGAEEHEEQESSDDDESGGSWSQSPESHLRPPPYLQPPRESSSPSPEKPSPPPPAPLPKSVTRSRVHHLSTFPSSSLGSEAEIEIEPPQAMVGMVELINRAARVALPQPTPPSAQIPVIPSTCTVDGSPPAKRLRRMKAPPFGSTQPSDLGPSPTSALPPAHPTHQSNSLTTDSSNSTSAATSQGQQQPSTVSHSAPSPVATAPASVDDRIAGKLLRRPGEDTAQDSPTLSKIPPNGPASQFPYTAFLIAYPHFTGNLGDFIRAAMCLEDIRRKKALPEFLYDDFIRVFCGPYLQYIEHLGDHPEREPLTAVQWYNDTVTKPAYEKGVISKVNVSDVMEVYPEQSRVIIGGIDLPSNSPRTREVTNNSDSNLGSPIRGSLMPNTPAQASLALVSPLPDLPPFAFKGSLGKSQPPHMRWSQERQGRDTGELLSDPISTAEPSQPPVRKTIPPISQPRRTSSGRPSVPGMLASGGRRRGGRLSEIQADDIDFPDEPLLSPFQETIMQTQPSTRGEPQRRRSSPTAAAPPSTAMSGVSSVPETAMKRKSTTRSLNRSISESSPSMFKKQHGDKRKRESVLWGKFLNMKLSQANQDSSGA